MASQEDILKNEQDLKVEIKEKAFLLFIGHRKSREDAEKLFVGLLQWLYPTGPPTLEASHTGAANKTNDHDGTQPKSTIRTHAPCSPPGTGGHTDRVAHGQQSSTQHRGAPPDIEHPVRKTGTPAPTWPQTPPPSGETPSHMPPEGQQSCFRSNPEATRNDNEHQDQREHMDTNMSGLTIEKLLGGTDFPECQLSPSVFNNTTFHIVGITSPSSTKQKNNPDTTSNLIQHYIDVPIPVYLEEDEPGMKGDRTEILKVSTWSSNPPSSLSFEVWAVSTGNPNSFHFYPQAL